MVLVRATALLIAFAIGCAILIYFLALPPRHSYARDLGQWEQQDPLIRAWFEHLKQPDHPQVSCCSFADAYYADTVETKDGQLIAVITDDRPDEPLGRPHVPVGTRIVVPPNKIKWDKGNPTGHIVIFLSYDQQVLCYVQDGGY